MFILPGLVSIKANDFKDMFKEDPHVREKVKEEVDSIIKSYDW